MDPNESGWLGLELLTHTVRIEHTHTSGRHCNLRSQPNFSQFPPGRSRITIQEPARFLAFACHWPSVLRSITSLARSYEVLRRTPELLHRLSRHKSKLKQLSRAKKSDEARAPHYRLGKLAEESPPRPRSLTQGFSQFRALRGARLGEVEARAAARQGCPVWRIHPNVRFLPDFVCFTPRSRPSWWCPRSSAPDPKETLTLLLSATGERPGFASGSVPRSRTQRDLSLPPCPPGPTSPNCPAMLRSARPENAP